MVDTSASMAASSGAAGRTQACAGDRGGGALACRDPRRAVRRGDPDGPRPPEPAAGTRRGGLRRHVEPGGRDQRAAAARAQPAGDDLRSPRRRSGRRLLRAVGEAPRRRPAHGRRSRPTSTPATSAARSPRSRALVSSPSGSGAATKRSTRRPENPTRTTGRTRTGRPSSHRSPPPPAERPSRKATSDPPPRRFARCWGPAQPARSAARKGRIRSRPTSPRWRSCRCYSSSGASSGAPEERPAGRSRSLAPAQQLRYLPTTAPFMPAAA